MIQSIARISTKFVQRWLPDAFIFSIILTAIVFTAGIFSQNESPATMVRFWGDGIWNLLTFAMQVILTLITGHVLAQSRPVKIGLSKIATLAKTPSQAIMLMTFIALIACWLNWGFGLIASALLAKELARQVRGVHFPLLVASAYSGILIWHAGLSGSIPLKLAMVGGGFGVEQVIPVSQTMFSFPILVTCLVMLLSLPIINSLMLPSKHEVQAFEEIPIEQLQENFINKNRTPAERLENSVIISFLLAGIGLWYLFMHFTEDGALDLNSLNLIFLVLGILFHGTPASYLNAVNDAVKGAAGIVIQFPLYAGIMGMVVQSGLATSISTWFVSISTEATFPVLTFLSAGLVNLFVPSGGGQWAVQAPIVVPAALSLGVPLHQAAMAVALGDAWTNMAQPFWALPLLGIAGLGIRDIMGYCIVALLWSGFIFSLGLSFLY